MEKQVPNVAGPWAGRLYGTNTGNVFIELQQEGTSLRGIARFLDDAFGLVIYELTGSVGERIDLKLVPKEAPDGIEVGEGTASGYLQPDGTLRGQWQTALGTAGTFQLFPHSERRTTGGPPDITVPEQLFDHSAPLGSVRLYKRDLETLLETISRDFLHARPVVTYRRHGGSVTQFADKFLKELDSLEQLRALKITIQEPEAYGINKVVVVDLREDLGSEIRVSGLRESWVLGKLEGIIRTLKRYQNRVVTGYLKYGLNLNSIIFLLMLVAIPEVGDLRSRLVFVAAVTGILVALHAIHARLIPNTLIFPTTPEPGFLGRIWPSIVSWLIATTSALFAAWLFDILRRTPK